MKVFKINRSEFVLAPSLEDAIDAWKKVIGNKYKTFKVDSIELICEINIDWYAITTAEMNK